MQNGVQLKSLEEELERIRMLLYQSVQGEPTRLSDPDVLPLSQALDALIVQIQQQKQRQSYSTF